ncbi:hypothetical protein [Enterobacter asburiae]|uniref:Uncharacterized protein n=1 Tax=Enterobacter asburiae TaxID=61645 RepID=A0A8I1G1P9_ENTAS|nr:hypothetical protein [Enterobacter asburiae]MBJ6598774.1 hypothetical protein [Enterobacter asburiae]
MRRNPAIASRFNLIAQRAATTRTDAQNKSCHHVWRAVLSPPRLRA